jgi:hypothetical protein
MSFTSGSVAGCPVTGSPLRRTSRSTARRSRSSGLADPAGGGASEAERAAAAERRIRRFREETRGRRMDIARDAEHEFRRKVSWGVTCGEVSEMFTTLSVPEMTRLRQPERRVLDTLVDAGAIYAQSMSLAGLQPPVKLRPVT